MHELNPCPDALEDGALISAGRLVTVFPPYNVSRDVEALPYYWCHLVEGHFYQTPGTLEATTEGTRRIGESATLAAQAIFKGRVAADSQAEPASHGVCAC